MCRLHTHAHIFRWFHQRLCQQLCFCSQASHVKLKERKIVKKCVHSAQCNREQSRKICWLDDWRIVITPSIPSSFHFYAKISCSRKKETVSLAVHFSSLQNEYAVCSNPSKRMVIYGCSAFAPVFKCSNDLPMKFFSRKKNWITLEIKLKRSLFLFKSWTVQWIFIHSSAFSSNSWKIAYWKCYLNSWINSLIRSFPFHSISAEKRKFFLYKKHDFMANVFSVSSVFFYFHAFLHNVVLHHVSLCICVLQLLFNQKTKKKQIENKHPHQLLLYELMFKDLIFSLHHHHHNKKPHTSKISRYWKWTIQTS